MEHIERAGVHSGDSISVYPAKSLTPSMVQQVVKTTTRLAEELHVKGMINIQYIVYNNQLYIIEVNPRSSRTVPYISKVTGVPMIELAVGCSIGKSLKSMGYGTGLHPATDVYAIKVPVFSFEKLPELEVSLGPEMKSTGEVLGLSRDYNMAVLQGLLAAGMRVPEKGKVLITVNRNDKQEAVRLAEDLVALGYKIYATPGTANALNHGYVPASVVGVNEAAADMLLHDIRQSEYALIISTPTHGRDPQRLGFRIRRTAVECKVPCLTSLDTVAALVQSLKIGKGEKDLVPYGLHQLVADVEAARHG